MGSRVSKGQFHDLKEINGAIKRAVELGWKWKAKKKTSKTHVRGRLLCPYNDRSCINPACHLRVTGSVNADKYAKRIDEFVSTCEKTPRKKQ